MLAIGLRFLAGRYHATPPGRHVNEGDVEWPPAPWRFVRALISTWYHKADHQLYPYAQLEQLVDTLSETTPAYQLPKAVHAHTRHYMPQGRLDKGRERTSLVFDPFARIDPQAELIMAWPELEPDAAPLALLRELLGKLGYLGRAESWVEARLLPAEAVPDRFDCIADTSAAETGSGEINGENVQLLAPQPGGHYREWRQQFVATELPHWKGKPKKALLGSLPEGLTGALSLDSSVLRQAGWSQPPAGRFVSYLRPVDCLRPALNIRHAPSPRVTSARYLVVGRPLPRIEEALRVGEWLRAALMSRARRVSPELSGHGLDADNRHGHAFFLPEDADGDGYIDHLLVHAADGLSGDTQHAISGLATLRGRQGIEWHLVLETLGDAQGLGDGCGYLGENRNWRSATPYLRPWYLKTNRPPEQQTTAFIRKECRLRGLPEPRAIEFPETIPIHGKERHCIHFHRFRNKRGLRQPDTVGSFLLLHFAEAIRGPLALGFGCHYGLGLFKPESSE